MAKSKIKRFLSLFLAMTICLSTFVGLGSTTAFAAGTTGKSYIVSFPRGTDSEADYSGSWGHDKLSLMNGWAMANTKYTNLYTIDDYDGKIGYCIEPGTPIDNGDVFSQRDETFWDNYPSDFNKTIEPYLIKLFVGRILQYGYAGNVSTSWVSQDSDGANKIAQAYATQILIWETIVGERDENFIHVSPGAKDSCLDAVNANHPLKSKIYSYYNSIEASVQKHSKVPSFCGKSTGKAQTIELDWNGAEYTKTLTDTNGVLSDYIFSSSDSNLHFTVSGNKLTITSSKAPSDTVTITAERKNSQRKGLIVWDDGKYAPGVGRQNLVSYTQSVNDPVKAYLKVKVSYGNAKIVKTSEDGKVDGISFTIRLKSSTVLA